MVTFGVQHFSKLLICASILGLCISCSSGKAQNQSEVKPKTLGQGASLIRKDIYTDAKGRRWVPLRSVAASLGLNYKERGGIAEMGYTDVMYRVKVDRGRSSAMGKNVRLTNPAIMRDNQVWITLEDASKLLGTTVKATSKPGRLEIGHLPPIQGQGAPQKGSFQPFSSVDAQELIAYAKRFLGVPYEFGAGDYSVTKTFDCSSFTRYVFKHFGVNLPRLASEQATKGTAVNRSELKAGDLVFFTVPGRFENDKIPGHVGIYAGNGSFIHTWGAPGVQISSLDTGYWKGVILSMRRVL
ncbi:C40 family peptidase [Paenibacillus sp. J22TS3]|uniref:C40 family peptidase n=1 Tax=Paenibacillus sp. J22TS3 TaxID=2807192 RepID=UPI001FD3923B|nr:C40 family peptidase [Paenibacillus sp. J22TS3]